MHSVLIIFSVVVTLLLQACDSPQETQTPPTAKLTIYSGITMVRPLSKLAKEFEQKHNIKIEIKQGGSSYLFKAIKAEKKGDIFFPGSDSYRKKSLKNRENILKDCVFVGYNRIALVVAKGNPKHITNDLNQLANPTYSVVLSSPESGAVGKNAKTLLDNAGIKQAVYENVTYFTTDSHRIFRAIKKQEADIALNWYATTKWPETENYMDAILLPNNIAKPKRLELSLLSYSKNPDLAMQFMNYTASKHGLEVFKNFGFLTNTEFNIAVKHLSITSKNKN